MPTKKVPTKKGSAKKTLPKAKPNFKKSYAREANKIMAEILSEIDDKKEINLIGSVSARPPRLSLTPPKLPQLSYTFPQWLKFSFTRPAW